jgi:PAS domain S-box-containing protein
MKSRGSKIPTKTRPDDPNPESGEPPAAPPEPMRAILDEIPVQAWCALSDGTTEFRNRAWLDYAGVKAEDCGRQGWSDTVHPDDRERCANTWAEIRASGAAGEIDARLRRRDGEYRWFRVRIVPLRDGRGCVTKWYGTNADIDDHKRAEAMLSRERVAPDLLGGAEEQPVNHFFVLQGQRCQLMWEREDDMSVGRQQQLGAARFEPAVARLALALRAVPISACVKRDGPMAAAGTLIQMTSHGGGPASFDCREHFQVRPGEPAPEAAGPPTGCSSASARR